MEKLNSLGIVVIGRNEGNRLISCLESVLVHSDKIVYVDSGSSDNSKIEAANRKISVVNLDTEIPFTAARARNVGFDFLIQNFSSIDYVQFIDGDCDLDIDWPKAAMDFLVSNGGYGIVCGRRHERFPKNSIYNQLCDMEWNTLIGESVSCGGDFLIKKEVFQKIRGFNQMLIAGEEPEMCIRLSEIGYKIYRLDQPMTFHDADMNKFSQWWKRAMRSGYAYAQVGKMHKKWGRRDTYSNLFYGLLPVVLILFGFLVPFFFAGVLFYIILYLKVKKYRERIYKDSKKNAAIYALFCVLAKFPQAVGALRFFFLKSKTQIIEYK